MCYALGDCGVVTVGGILEYIVHRAVLGADESLYAAEAVHLADVDVKTAAVLDVDTAVACTGAGENFLLHYPCTSLLSIR